MIPRILTAVFLCFSLHAASQLPTLNWAKAFNGIENWGRSSGGNSRTVGVDLQGNVYTAGLFPNAVDFDPGPGVYTMQPADIGSNIFISKLDAEGNFVWAKQIPTYVEFGRINLKVDASGNIYLVSDLNQAADMDPGPGVFMMAPTGFRDAFILKLNTDGNLVWAKQFGGPGDTGPQGDMVELDRNGNVIITGIFNNTVDFDPGPSVFNITSSAHMQGFIVKLTNEGNLVWAKQFGNGPEVYSGSRISDLKFDRQGNIVCTGSYSRTVDFDPGPGTYMVTISPGAVEDGFICKLDADANFIWVKTLDQNGTNNHFLVPTGLAIDGMNNIITTGFYIGNYDFDPGPGTQVVYSNPHDCYILKLNQQGDLVWAKTIGGSETDAGYDVAVDADNNIFTIGGFGPSVDFDPGPADYTITSPYYGAAVLLKLLPDGNLGYAAPFQSVQSGTAYFSRMVSDAARNIYITGAITGENDFDPGPGVYSFASGYGGSSFVMKLSPCLNSTRSVQTMAACNSYTLNGQTYSATGTYQQTLLNVAGCDSVITLHLVINKKFTEQTKTICEGEFFYAGGRNQTTSGTYYDTLVTTTGCDSVVLTRLTVHPKPLPNLGTDKSLCKDTQVTISPGTFTSYVWHDNSTAPTFTAGTAGLYWVQVTNSFNCTARDTFRVTHMIEPPADFLKQTDSICRYETLELSPLRPFQTYQWSTGAATKNIQVQSPGAYSLTVRDGDGCHGTDTITVWQKQCMEGLYLPSAFTPNHDGKNDVFRPSVFGNLLHYRLTIYNRWGQLVFQTSDPKKGWEGKVAGTLQDTGAFVWICDYHLEGSERKTERGSLMLIR
jgi:gliding motility-associated-like protein